ncbi:MAG TPA: mechanosensitive ion channel family protein [Deinococcales bacterium]|nr:mechanosensitive ion channel family protein [Deinococcales bacterium]
MNVDLTAAVGRIQAMLEGFVRTLPNIVLAIIVFVLFLFLGRWAQALAGRAAGDRRALGMLLRRLTQAGVILLGTLAALAIVFPTFGAGDLIGVLGISSVAIGFAFRDILQNFLAGILLLLTEPFRVGDQIISGGYEGTVEDIQTRATFIRTYDGRRVVIPNADLFTSPVTVNTAFEKRRLEYDVGIGFGDDVEQARALILAVLREADGVLPDPAPEALVVDLAESSVNIRARWWISPPRQADTFAARDTVLAAIKTRLVENGIDLPFPTRQVLFHDQTERTDGDRARQRDGWPAGKGEAPGPQRISDAIRGLAKGGSGASREGTGNDRPDRPRG